MIVLTDVLETFTKIQHSFMSANQENNCLKHDKVY